MSVEHVNEKSGIPIQFNDWLIKAGCSPEQSAELRVRFEQPPDAAVRAFHIEPQPDGDIHFIGRRVVLKARKT